MIQTIMIADDSIPLHALIKTQLNADNLIFHSVYDGVSAVSTASKLKPDLILLDIDMPNMDGFEACRRLKENPVTASIPLMFLSGDSLSANKHKAIHSGAFAYLQKPFNPEQLKASVYSKLHAISTTKSATQIDPATGLWNKEYFLVQLREQFILSQLASQAISCAVAEIDQLGSIRVRLGNKIANQLIQKVTARLLIDAGTNATVCGLPNHRFAALYRNANRFDTKHRLEQLRSELGQNLALDDGTKLGITCSFGVCDSQIASAMTLFDRATSVLNRAVNRGGNCVAVSRSESGPISKPALH